MDKSKTKFCFQIEFDKSSKETESKRLNQTSRRISGDLKMQAALSRDIEADILEW